MPAIDTEAQFKFLLCCIKHSAAGKVNFDNVAQELQIVSKAAAAKRYERLLKAHNITLATARKGGAAANADAAEDSGEPKTPASKKRKRATASTAKKDEDEETPVKKERGVKKERALKKEDSDSDVRVKGEDGSFINNTTTTITAAAPCCVGGVIKSDLPEASPRRQDPDGHRPGGADADDDYCVVVSERPVILPSPVSVPVPVPVDYAAHGHGHGPSHGALLTPPDFGYHHHHHDHHHAVHCHDANLAFPLQTMSTSRSNSALEASTAGDATPSSQHFGNWSISQTSAPPSEFYCGGHHLLQ
ncbi:hypothetical protein C8A01DRAFT_12887 [Parachaetomium inaequale]|uniref:Myb-like DNA-binding domain-containing protein n=1 Tax=Parachaetomium inaequale TaxID=2588326 RepID=A0AAN6PPF8_9PEZI|nr:hypothetical protein C8A01DRAFT_12887 [Parachaetomium inaequale]